MVVLELTLLQIAASCMILRLYGLMNRFPTMASPHDDDSCSFGALGAVRSQPTSIQDEYGDFEQSLVDDLAVGNESPTAKKLREEQEVRRRMVNPEDASSIQTSEFRPCVPFVRPMSKGEAMEPNPFAIGHAPLTRYTPNAGIQKKMSFSFAPADHAVHRDTKLDETRKACPSDLPESEIQARDSLVHHADIPETDVSVHSAVTVALKLTACIVQTWQATLNRNILTPNLNRRLKMDKRAKTPS